MQNLVVLATQLNRLNKIGVRYSNQNPQLAALAIGMMQTEIAELYRQFPELRPATASTLTHEEERLLFNHRDKKIEVIKSVRSRTGLGLKETKDLVEAWMQKHLGFTHYPL